MPLDKRYLAKDVALHIDKSMILPNPDHQQIILLYVRRTLKGTKQGLIYLADSR